MARHDGWRSALFRVAVARAAAGRAPDEDERTADWIPLLGSTPREAVVVGIGWGAVAAALARAGARVSAFDRAAERVGLLTARAEQDGLAVRCARVTDPTRLDLPDANADLVAFTDPGWPGARPAAAREARRLLRPGGQLVWRAHNALGVPRRAATAPATLGAHRAMIRREGFEGLRAYAPLPAVGVPFVHVPLGDAGAMRHFLRHLLPLAATASPEARRRYGLAGRLASLASAAADLPLAAHAAAALAPQWLLFATLGAPGDAR